MNYTFPIVLKIGYVILEYSKNFYEENKNSI